MQVICVVAMHCFHKFSRLYRFPSILIAILVLTSTVSAATSSRKRRAHRTSKQRVTAVKRSAKSTTMRSTSLRGSRATLIRGGPWTEPTYANSTDGDRIDGEDLQIRRAAVDALGPFNGSVVVVDPTTGRILSMVNQKLALG